jgi:hypothetical protein
MNEISLLDLNNTNNVRYRLHVREYVAVGPSQRTHARFKTPPTAHPYHP